MKFVYLITVILAAAASAALAHAAILAACGGEKRFFNRKLLVRILTAELFTAAAMLVTFGGPQVFLKMTAGKMLLSLVFGPVCALLQLGYALFHKQENAWKKSCLLFAMLALMSVIAEVFVCNFRHFESMDYKETVLTPTSLNGLRQTDEGDYVVTAAWTAMEFENVGIPVENIFLGASLYTLKQGETSETVMREEEPALEATISFADEANALYRSARTRTIAAGQEESSYIKCSFSGEVERLKISFSTEKGQVLSLEPVKVNAVRPFVFHGLRFSVFLILSACFVLLRPASPLHSISYIRFVRKPAAAVVMAVILVLQCSFFALMAFNNPTFTRTAPFQHHTQYQRLARCLLKGQVYLDEEPAPALQEMENPYDTNLRDEVMAQSGQFYRWDHAYHDGHYYVYFGVVPVLLLYIPYYLITGSDMPNFIGVVIFSMLFAAAVYALTAAVVRRWFRRTSLASYLLIVWSVITASCVVYLLKRPDFYSIPIIAALAFTAAGYALWISASGKGKNGGLSGFRLCLGSLCMALVAGCRPQLLLLSFGAVFLFWPDVFRRRTLLSKKSIWQTAAFCVPYVIVAAGIMYYNFARFGSVFDFGANYNLTTNDMTKRGIVWERTGSALFSYFFQLPKLISTFPFLRSADLDTLYVGTVISETTYGGLLICYPFLLAIFAVGKAKATLKKKGLFGFVLMWIGTAFLLGWLDAQMAGILQRYFSDFGFVMAFGAALIVLALLEKRVKTPEMDTVNGLLLTGCAAGGAYSFILFFCADNLAATTPELYYSVWQAVQFWN